MFRMGSQSMSCTGLAAPLPSETAGGAFTASLTQRWQTAGTTTTSTTTISQPLQACELEDYWPMPLSASAGTLVAGAVLSAWFAAWAWKAYGRTLTP